jgi:hypothetical protein
MKLPKIVFSKKGKKEKLKKQYWFTPKDMYGPTNCFVWLEVFSNGQSRFYRTLYIPYCIDGTKDGRPKLVRSYYEMNLNFLKLDEEFREHIWRWFMRDVEWDAEYVNMEIVPITEKGRKKFKKWLEEVQMRRQNDERT